MGKPLFYPSLLLPLLIAVASSALATDAPPGLSVSVSAGGGRVYQGEVVPITVALRADGLTVRNVRFPSLDSPPRISFEARENPGVDGSGVVQYLFTGRFRAPASRSVRVGPVTVECEVVDRVAGAAGFFGTEEFRDIKVSAPAREITIEPLPAAGRPASFHGAVGKFDMTVSARPSSVNAGEPITVTTLIHGKGDLAAAACPNLSLTAGRNYPAKRRLRSGALACEQVLVPAAGNQLPSIEWTFFDPEAAVYSTLRHDLGSTVKLAAPPITPPVPRPVRVAPATSPHQALLPRLLIAACLLVGISTLAMKRLRKPGPVKDSYQTDLFSTITEKARRAAADGDVEKFYTAAFPLLQLLAAAVTTTQPPSRSSIAFLPPGSPKNLFPIWHRCDLVRYGRGLGELSQMKEDCDVLLSHVSKILTHSSHL